MKQKVIYYKDELSDEFAGDEIKPKTIDGTYVYVHRSLFKRFTHFFWYRMIAFPIAWFYLKFKLHHKIENKKVLKLYRRKAYFIFGNHTHNIADAVMPTFVTFNKVVHVIVHANNVSMPYLGRITPSLGAIPLPDDKNAYKNFLDAIEYRLKQKRVIAIYPEAHIWPFYTKIRPFTEKSFRYPVDYDTPVFCFTNTYQKRKFSYKPKMVTYVDGPFFADKSLSKKERQLSLRNQVFEAMTERSQANTIEVIKYMKEVQ